MKSMNPEKMFSNFQNIILSLTLLIVILITASAEAQVELNKNETPTYQQVISFYEKLAEENNQINIEKYGETDSGYPLHLVSYHPKKSNTEVHTNKKERKLRFLINNGIHPGEPDGINASMKLFQDLSKGTWSLPDGIILYNIPIYNIGGAINRNSTSRVNQNGPVAYGFRGNARNFDLNRDFIKMDSKNTKAFAAIYHKINPDVFVDTHVSNGADYQYTLTHLFTQHNKLGGEMGQYLKQQFQPKLEKLLADKQWPITPYVNVYGTTPDNGWSQFMDYPRYSSGYTTLWNTLGLMIETHMLKPFPQRVKGTFEMLKTLLELSSDQREVILVAREKNNSDFLSREDYPIQWELDSNRVTYFKFKGYEGRNLKSDVTELKRLKYSKEPFEKEVKYYDYFKPSRNVLIPQFYVIPKAQWEVIDRLVLNGVVLKKIQSDTVMSVIGYRIKDYETRTAPYEGHYLHYNTKVEQEKEKVKFFAGDFLVSTNQKARRYLIETLEPEATDSFFNWNFFDTILQQKEDFSPYVFEDLAYQILRNNTNLKNAFEQKKKMDIDFAKNSYAQLDWIYKRSKYAERAFKKYPIFKIESR